MLLTHKTTRSHGFSLIELVVVVTVISIVAGLSLSVGSTHIKVSQVKNSTQTLENIKTALLTYQRKTGRYPCPANPALASTNVAYGTEEVGCATACPVGLVCNSDIIEGFIPFNTIGLSESSAYDSWENKITYIVDKNHTVSSDYTEGTVPIRDISGNEITTSTVLGKAIFILLSHGKDGKGAYKKNGVLRVACGAITADSENCDGDDIYRYASINEAGNETTTATYYQDFLTWHVQRDAKELITTKFSIGVTSLIVPDAYTCIITSVGKLQCTGLDNDGQLGNGALGATTSFTDENNSFTDWKIVAGDHRGACAIRSNGRAYCWGDNSYGQIGDSTTIQKQVPTEVNGGHTDWRYITKIDEATCGIRNSGIAYCWGRGTKGNLGDGMNTSYAVPTAIAGGFSDWISLSMGYSDHTSCGLRSSGKIYCWGENINGGVGDGTYTDRNTPTEVAGGFTDWKSLGSIGIGTCAIRNNGRAYCWGENDDGQVGDGTKIDRNIPTEVNGGHTDWKMIFKGNNTACGIRGTGIVYCWGDNTNGQLGTGAITADITTPTAITTIYTDFVTVRTDGTYQSCAVRQNGRLYCWGKNQNGGFGNGTTSLVVVSPTLISGVTVNTTEQIVSE